MKYTIGTPNRKQKQYIDMIQKLDPDVDPSSIVLKVPDFHDIQEKYNKKLEEAKNNFERMKIKRNFELWQPVIKNLVQIQFYTYKYEFPLYFEIVAKPIRAGMILEHTINTIVNKSQLLIFFGKTIINKLRFLFMKAELKLNLKISGEFFDLDAYIRGETEIITRTALLRWEIGTRLLRVEGSKSELVFDGFILKLNADPFIQEFLQKLCYASCRKFRLADLPKREVSFRNLDVECMGCIHPISEDYSLIQVGDFSQINKSTSYLLLKRLLTVLLEENEIFEK